MKERTWSGAAVGLALLIGASAAVAQEMCEDGRRPYGSLGIGLYQCVGGSCSINMESRASDEGRLRHSFSTEPRLREIRPPGASVLREGDVLVAVDDRLITSAEGGERLGALQPGDDVKLTIRRDGRELDAWLTAERSCRYAGLEVSTRGSRAMTGDSTVRFSPIYTARAGNVGYALSNDTTWARYGMTLGDSVRYAFGDSVGYLFADSMSYVFGDTVAGAFAQGLRPGGDALTAWSHVLTPGVRFRPDGSLGKNVLTLWGSGGPARPSVEFGVAISCGDCGWRSGPGGLRFVTSEFPVIDAVEAGGPAAEAGVLAGDILIAIDGLPIPTDEGGRRLGILDAGERVILEVRRADRILEVSIAPRESGEGRLRM